MGVVFLGLPKLIAAGMVAEHVVEGSRAHMFSITAAGRKAIGRGAK